MSLSEGQLTDAALSLAAIAATIANVCDHAEHNEATDMDGVRHAARELRALAVALADDAGCDPVGLYAERLQAIEERNVLRHELTFDGKAAVVRAQTWRDLQLAQIEHDRAYHPDVFGLKKADQLCHYALHLAKLAGAASNAAKGLIDQEDFLSRRVADALLFGIKLSTVSADRLSDDRVPQSPAPEPKLDSIPA
jgi:hypothetical protein